MYNMRTKMQNTNPSVPLASTYILHNLINMTVNNITRIEWPNDIPV